MNTRNLYSTHWRAIRRAVAQRLPANRWPPALRTDAEAMLFSAKTFVAAMLAYYIALRIGLSRPYWSVLTVYIVSQPSAGASLSRGVHRLAGTLAGAIATVLIVPRFVNEPIACSLALSCWIGLCLYCSLLDRTPRAYAFVLAGYTASLIGFPSVSDPAAVFDTAAVRVQEIVLGIVCAVLAHRYLLPRPMTGQFAGKLAAALRDAHRLALDTVRGQPSQETRQARKQLAVDLLALQGLATHLPYDPVPSAPRHVDLQRIHDRLAHLLPLAGGIEDRLHALDTDRCGELASLLADVSAWHATADAEQRDAAALPLIERARNLARHRRHGGIAASLAGLLAEMVALLHDCDLLTRRIGGGRGAHATRTLHWGDSVTGYVYHRDALMALRAALGAVAGVGIGCAFWIWSAWPDGATAVSLLGVCCALFGNVDAPAANVRKYMAGSVYGVAISLVYGFAVLPRVTGFAVLVAVLAPVLLFAGSLQARPSTAFMALGITLTVPILAGLGTRYSGDFAESINSAIALFAAIGFAAVSMSLFQTVPVDAAIERLLRLSRRDIRRRALGRGRSDAHWTSLMVDRTALLFPRLRLSARPRVDLLGDMVRHVRIGYAVARLRQAVRQSDTPHSRAACAILAAVADAFGKRMPAPSDEIAAIAARIDVLIADVSDDDPADPLLLDLRLALAGPAVPPTRNAP